MLFVCTFEQPATDRTESRSRRYRREITADSGSERAVGGLNVGENGSERPQGWASRASASMLAHVDPEATGHPFDGGRGLAEDQTGNQEGDGDN